jgi:two-component system chemotaxis response regulator CheY
MTDSASTPVSAGKRILVVDDHLDFGNFVRRVAEKEGFVVELVDTAEGFRAAYQTTLPAIVCLDIVMPQEDGIELIQWLIGQQSKAAIYIITGHNPSYARAALEIGRSQGLNIAGVLQKPVSLVTLRDMLSAAGEGRATVAAD